MSCAGHGEDTCFSGGENWEAVVSGGFVAAAGSVRHSIVDLDSLEDTVNHVRPMLALSRFAIWYWPMVLLLYPVMLLVAALIEFATWTAHTTFGMQVNVLSLVPFVASQAGRYVSLLASQILDPASHPTSWISGALLLATAWLANRLHAPVVFMFVFGLWSLLLLADAALRTYWSLGGMANLMATAKPFFGTSVSQLLAEGIADLFIVATVAVIMMRGFMAARTLDPQLRTLVADLPPSAPPVPRDAALFLGLPPNIAHSSLKVLTALFAAVGNLTIMLPYLALLSLSTAVWVAILTVEPYLRPSQADRLQNHMIATVEVAGVLAGMSVLFVLCFLALRSAARRFLRHSIVSIQQRDERKPILFLRSFADDAVTLKRASRPLSSVMFDLSRRVPNLDLVVLDEGTLVGPVVALGNPRDRIPPYGVARGYFDNRTWQQGVHKLATDARAIVIVLDDTPGVRIEIDMILEAGYESKTLFILHPKNFKTRSPALADSLTRIEAALGLPNESLRAPKVLAAYRRPHSVDVDIVHSSTFSWSSYHLLVRRFFRQLSTPSAAT